MTEPGDRCAQTPSGTPPVVAKEEPGTALAASTGPVDGQRAIVDPGEWSEIQANQRWALEQRRWSMWWRRLLFPTIFLVYLVAVVSAISSNSSGWAAVIGYVLVGVFCTVYIGSLPQAWRSDRRVFWAYWAVLVALFVAELPLAHEAAFVMCVYIVAVSVARFNSRGLVVAAIFTGLSLCVPPIFPSWHQGWVTAFNDGDAIAIPMIGVAMWGFFNIMRSNRALADARSQIARLAAENERTRIARDLHDLLGHSLTGITVKAELARRLAIANPAAAMQEMAEVEALSRRALADVRAAVANYREVTLVGELATGRELLRAAGVAADLPRGVEVVDQHAQELFGWALREGLTNVVRHARATTCTVTITANSVEVVDDGVGRGATGGQGLMGLKERLASAGGALEAGPLSPRGWRLKATLPNPNARPPS